MTSNALNTQHTLMEVDTSGSLQSILPSSLDPSSTPTAMAAAAPPIAAAVNTSSAIVAASSSSLVQVTTTQIPPPPQSPSQQSKVQDLSHQATPLHHNKSHAVRKNKIYFSLQVPLSTIPADKKVVSTIKLNAYHQSLSKVIKTLTKINDMLVFWPFEFPNSLESDLLNNPSALSESIHQIQKFFNEFCIKKLS